MRFHLTKLPCPKDTRTRLEKHQDKQSSMNDIKMLFALAFVSLLAIAFASNVMANTDLQETIVVGEEIEWTHADEFNRIYDQTGLTEKEKVVQQVESKTIRWPKYEVRVGYEGKRKPIPSLKGLTVDERAKQLLDTVGIGDTLPIWKKFWEQYGIDYTLPIAIWFSDSHLWKALKSKNNIGNIWNNDRWDVKHFNSLEAWIEAIFWTLAHWKYMQGHTTIGTLSGEGRKRLWLPWCNEEKEYRKKCYATSMGVWSTNTINIMSAMHDKQITEEYNFRLK